MTNKEYNKLFNKDYSKLFKDLDSKIKDLGLKDKIPIRGSFEILIVLSLFVVSIYSIFNFAYYISIFLLVLTFMRSTYVAHDVIHQQYYKNKKLNKFFSYIFGNIIIGVSADWWERDHNIEHHTWTNSAERDEDIKAFTFFIKNKKGPNWLHDNKYIIFWMTLPFIWLSFHYQSWKFLFSKEEHRTPKKRYFFNNIITLLLHYLFVPLLLVYALPLNEAIISILSIYLIYGSLSALGFITNHIGMEVLEGNGYKTMNWFELQTRTSRNLDGGLFIHWLYGGLNTQIEHHLFPKAPRMNLLKIRKITEDFCKENNLFYYSVSPIMAYYEIFNELRGNKLEFLK